MYRGLGHLPVWHTCDLWTLLNLIPDISSPCYNFRTYYIWYYAASSCTVRHQLPHSPVAWQELLFKWSWILCCRLCCFAPECLLLTLARGSTRCLSLPQTPLSSDLLGHIAQMQAWLSCSLDLLLSPFLLSKLAASISPNIAPSDYIMTEIRVVNTALG